MAHPISESCLQRFAQGHATREERRTVLAHLLRGCPECRRELHAQLEPASRAQAFELDLERLTRVLLPDLEDAGRPPRRPDSTLSL